MKKRILTMALVAVMVMLCGCSKGMTAEDAQSYTKSVLDAAYKGEFTDYMKWTNSTEEESQEMYADNLDSALDSTGFDDVDISDELLDNYKELFKTMLSQAKYNIVSAEEDKDKNFIVQVEIEPYNTFSGMEEELTTILIDKVTKMETMPSDDEIYALTIEGMYDLMLKRMEAPTYGEKITVPLHVTKNDDGIYEVSEADLTEIDSLLFPADSF